MSIKYNNKNPFAYLGMGWAVENRQLDADHSPYIALDKLDPAWLAAIESGEHGGGDGGRVVRPGAEQESESVGAGRPERLGEEAGRAMYEAGTEAEGQT